MSGVGAWVTNIDGVRADKVELLTSELLRGVPGVVHGFTTRHGGVSPAPFDSLNLGSKVGDDRAAVDTNRRKVLEAAINCFAASLKGRSAAVR